ncbi:hypothetical protein QBC46DRAFT_425633 [Diplogelasinospora grovesii]|uniref:Uncharacterized protein n=1 Tax=Diplogelasinospora grovesii TaxID=303347 RepID=A0AAN6ND49_9PEZI|nr:hypothetical protein QBC46DRAFT_425633 [Diplogelasinospora grovesii]
MAYVSLDNAVFWTPPPAAGPKPASQNLQKPSVQHSAASSESRNDDSSDHEDDVQSGDASDPGSPSTAFKVADGDFEEPFLAEMAEPSQQMPSCIQPLSPTLETTAASVPLSPRPPQPPAELSSPSLGPLQTDQSATDLVEDPTCEGSHASKGSDTRSDITVREARGAAPGRDPFGLHCNEPRQSPSPSSRCEGDACQERSPCNWCTRHPRLSAALKRFRKNRPNRRETSGETESLKAGAEPYYKEPVLDSIRPSHGLLYASSDDQRETEHGPDGGQSPEHHHSHESDETSDPEPRHSRGLDDKRRAE